MKKKIQTNFFCKSNYWSKRMLKIKEIVKNIIKIDELDFKKNNSYILNLIFVDDKKIKNINKTYRKKNKATDVLSFPFFSSNKLKLIKEKNIYIGDIAASYEIINSRAKKNSFFLEFDKVWIHGFLHLLGYDHIKDRDYFKMEKIEKKFLKSIT